MFAWIFKISRKSICILKSYTFNFAEPSERDFDINACGVNQGFTTLLKSTGLD